ncbi:MAG: FAD-dependent oxidoreductase [Candidatus Kapaibacterium sp.]|nr:MAG: FAD-dependent oxidoreductase [Candidatus Kapabacteria bacterium]
MATFHQTTSFAEPHHCIVIGGGVAGITAAVRLAERGVRVTLVEARPDIGGRVQSLLDRESGDIIDNGQHLLMGCYDATLRLATTLGTMPLLRRQAALRVWFADCTNSFNLSNSPDSSTSPADIFSLDASRFPAELGMAWGMLTLRGLSGSERYGLLRFAARLKFRLVRPEGKTVLELLHEERQSERVIMRFWEPIVLATLNAPLHAASAMLLVQVMRLAFLSGREAAQMLSATTGLAEVFAPARKFLEERGSRVITASVKSLLVKNTRAEGIISARGEQILSDSIISAVSLGQCAKLFPAEMRARPEMQAWSGFASSPIISVYLWTDTDVVEQDFIALLGTQTQWVFNRRKLCDTSEAVPTRFRGHLSLTFSAASALAGRTNEEIVGECWRELQEVFPAAKSAQLLHSRVIRERHATPLFTPENECLRPETHFPAQVLGLNNVFLAGDWTRTHLPATIESAARSGEAAATTLWEKITTTRGADAQGELP